MIRRVFFFATLSLACALTFLSSVPSLCGRSVVVYLWRGEGKSIYVRASLKHTLGLVAHPPNYEHAGTIGDEAAQGWLASYHYSESASYRIDDWRGTGPPTGGAPPDTPWFWLGSAYVVPAWLPQLILWPYPILAFIRGPVRRWRRRRVGLCVKCGYDLTGNVTGVCSECGLEA